MSESLVVVDLASSGLVPTSSTSGASPDTPFLVHRLRRFTGSRVSGSRVSGSRVSGSRVPGSRVSGSRVWPADLLPSSCVAWASLPACRAYAWMHPPPPSWPCAGRPSTSRASGGTPRGSGTCCTTQCSYIRRRQQVGLVGVMHSRMHVLK